MQISFGYGAWNTDPPWGRVTGPFHMLYFPQHPPTPRRVSFFPMGSHMDNCNHNYTVPHQANGEFSQGKLLAIGDKKGGTTAKILNKWQNAGDLRGALERVGRVHRFADQDHPRVVGKAMVNTYYSTNPPTRQCNCQRRQCYHCFRVQQLCLHGRSS